MEEKPITQEYVNRLLVRILTWAILLGVIGLVSYAIIAAIQSDNQRMDEIERLNAKGVGEK